MYLIAIAVGLAMLLILWSRIELNILTTSEYTISSKKFGDEFKATKHVVLSDLHNHSLGKNNRKLIEKIDSITPDFVLIAGDMVTKRQCCVPSNAFTLLKTLSKKYKIYYAYGNHEQYFEQLLDNLEDLKLKETDIIKRKNLYSTWLEYKKRLSNLGVVFLDNGQSMLTMSHTDVDCLDEQTGVRGRDCKLSIHGLSLDMVYYLRSKKNVGQDCSDASDQERRKSVQEFLTSVLGKKDEDIFHILIAHNPIYFKEYAAWGADLIFSGHVHGGLIRLPFLGGVVSPSFQLFPKYDAGKFTKDGKHMIISRGLGTHSNMPRIFNPPELVVVNLSPKAD